MSIAYVSALLARGRTYEVVLSALKVSTCAVVQLLSAVSAVGDTRKHIRFTRSRWSALVLAEFLHLFPGVDVDNRLVSVLEYHLTFFGIVELFL